MMGQPWSSFWCCSSLCRGQASQQARWVFAGVYVILFVLHLTHLDCSSTSSECSRTCCVLMQQWSIRRAVWRLMLRDSKAFTLLMLQCTHSHLQQWPLPVMFVLHTRPLLSTKGATALACSPLTTPCDPAFPPLQYTSDVRTACRLLCHLFGLPSSPLPWV